MAENLPNPHDAFFRHSFSRLETARQFLFRFLPAEVSAVLDLSTLNLTKDSFVDADLKSSYSDLLFEISLAGEAAGEPTDGVTGEPTGNASREDQAVARIDRDPSSECLVYALFEHKSTPDRMTPLQMLRYMVRIWEQRQKQGRPLRPIIPVIVYHGVQEWTTARTLRELIEGPAELRGYTPDFMSHLIDLGRYNDEELPGEEVTLATLLMMKYRHRADMIERLQWILDLAREFLSQPDGEENLRAFFVYLSVGTKHLTQQQLRQHIEQAYGKRGEEIMGTIAEEWVEDGRREGLEKGLEKGREEGLERGLKRGIKKGREEGLEKGLRTGIHAVVELRFPEDHQRLTSRLDSIHSADRLTELLSRSRTAESIDELVAFADQQQQ